MINDEPLEAIDPKKFYTTDEVAEFARVLPRTICGYCQQGVFAKASKFGKRWLIPGSDVLRIFSSESQPDGM
jgi:hypothetical protein